MEVRASYAASHITITSLIIRHLDTLYSKGSIAHLDAAGVVSFVLFWSNIKLVSVSKWAPLSSSDQLPHLPFLTVRLLL